MAQMIVLHHLHQTVLFGGGQHGARHLTSWESVPHFQPVVLAVPVSTGQGVVFQVKGEEGEGDIHAGGYNNDERALQVVRVLVGEAWGFNEACGTGEVTGTFGTWDKGTKGKKVLSNSQETGSFP